MKTEKKRAKCALRMVRMRFEGREYKTLAHLGNEVTAGVKARIHAAFRDIKRL